MDIADLDRLCTLLAEQIADPERCYFGLCEINHPSPLTAFSDKLDPVAEPEE